MPYLVMEYIDGSDLSRLVYRFGRLSVALALDFTIQAARGLEYAHSQGVVHRDVKPSNLLVDAHNVIKISDLGLAMLNKLAGRAAQDDNLTAPGAVMGTFSYMAPEQIGGANRVDPRADIYGLGCTLFFLLVGRPPTEGTTNKERANWHCTAAVPSLRSHREEISELLDETFQRMLAKSPDNRQQSMTQVIEELQTCRELIDTPRPKGADDAVTTLDQRLDDTGGKGSRTVDSPEESRPSGVRRWGLWALVVVVPLIVLSALFAQHLLGVFVGGDPGIQSVEVDPLPVITNSIGMELTKIQSGDFVMGAPPEEEGSEDRERPRHDVKITKPFYMGTFEVTKQQYSLVMDSKNLISKRPEKGNEPAVIDEAKVPITNITWHDAIEFCDRLSKWPQEQQHGRTYRLPTEAEWEYCCRAGTTTPFSSGEDITPEQANFGGKWRPASTKFPGRPRVLEVGSYEPNPWGLYDMHGNVQEYCLDKFGDYHHDAVEDPKGSKTGQERIIRGSAVTYAKNTCRSAYRHYLRPEKTNEFTGFRVVCVIEPN